jgi:hypothetical protein
MPAYMLLLYDGPANYDLSADEMQKIIEKYTAWRDALARSGKLITSDRLVDGEGRVVRRDHGKVRVLDGPFSETKEVIGGYFAIEAADYDEAVSAASECPHVEFGTIEVRRIDKVRGCNPD